MVLNVGVIEVVMLSLDVALSVDIVGTVDDADVPELAEVAAIEAEDRVVEVIVEKLEVVVETSVVVNSYILKRLPPSKTVSRSRGMA